MSSSPVPALLNDLYQLTMAQSYLASGMAERKAAFELFFRRAPHGGAFALAAGMGPALELVEGLRFSPGDIEYLRSLKVLGEDLLRRLQDFRFSGDLDLLPEGTVAFPGEPLLRVTAPLLEAQLLETPLLNSIGFATLVATKAARMVLAASPAELVEFGCRRAQGPDGAMTASRSAFIGGASSTSNLEAGRRFGIPVRGTMAHSFVMAFPSELEAFRAYTRAYPDRATLLIDTHHTLSSGLPHAIAVARELRARGGRLRAVRIDSGDLSGLARSVRDGLDAQGFPEVRIIASGDLDERRISRLRAAGAPIDAFGVGTFLVASEGDPALTAVYKLVAIEGGGAGEERRAGGLEPRMKSTDDPEKSTLPGMKQVFRRFDAAGLSRGDLLALAGEEPPPPEKGVLFRPLLEPAIRGGRRVIPPESLQEVRERARRALEALPGEHRRIEEPLPYPVSLSAPLRELNARLRSSGTS